MEVADIVDLRQCQKLFPVQRDRVFDQTADLEFP